MREEVREQISRLVPSLAMVVLALLLKEMKLHVATLLAVIVLLFAADQKTMTTIVRVISAHLLIIAVIAVISRDGQTTFSTTTTWTAAVIISAITGAFVAIEYHQVTYFYLSALYPFVIFTAIFCVVSVSSFGGSYSFTFPRQWKSRRLFQGH